MYHPDQSLQPSLPPGPFMPLLNSLPHAETSVAGEAADPSVDPLVQVPSASKVEDAQIFQRLRRCKRALGPKPNKNELAIVLISACILEGLNRRSRIVGALRAIGLDQTHVVLMLNHGTGSDPRRHHWAQDHERVYRLHDEQDALNA